ncbi:MAG: chemotaxis-specific protein-glutamate methyltransferase CheB [Candidatus Wallbacteria bacterium]|nr:chemotaxis-specific protein-glutamate methyltransferase CheB [Candidatus Wallbacteria bacterium]
MTKVRVLVVEDSTTVRRHIVDALSSDPELEVVGEAADGATAIEHCKRLRPDVITLDIVMPGVDGLSAVEQIMGDCPTPILIVSSSTERGELFRTYEALAAGAVEVLEKPDGTEPEGCWEAELRATLKLVAKIRVITHPRIRLERAATRARPVAAPPLAPGLRAVVMGASTGGPAAVLQILRGLPADFPLPILLVIHIGKLFASSLAEWLDALSPLPVACALDGEPMPLPGRGRVVMAPPGCHLAVRDGRLRLEDGPERNYCRPSVDVLFESAASALGPKAVGCLLTGMGRDGARGLLALKQSGAPTIAQDETSSVVFGMPKEAIALDAAVRVLPVDRIAAALLELARGDPATVEVMAASAGNGRPSRGGPA